MKKLTLIIVFAALATGAFAATVTWVGGDVTHPTFWDRGTTANWSGGTGGLFYDGDAVSFGDTEAGTVSLRENVAPASVTFANTEGNDYTLSGSAGTETLTAAGGLNVADDGDVTIGTAIAGDGTVTKSGNGGGEGVLTLAGDNSFTGGTIFDGGQLVIQHNNALGTGTLEINDRGSNPDLFLDADALAVINDIVIGSVGESKEILLVRDGAQTAELSGTITINEDTAGNFLIEVGEEDTLTLSGEIDGDGGAGIKKSGNGTLVLSGANTFSGAISIDDGILAVQHNNALSTGVLTMKDYGLDPVFLLDSDGLTVANDIVIDDLNTTKTIKLDRDGTQTATLSGSITIAETTAGNFIIEVGADDILTMSGVVSNNTAGGAGIDKIGDGTLVLSDANIYSGPTTIEAGTLAVNGNNSGAAGAVTVEDGATLAGSGTVGGAVTVKNGGEIAPGSSVGTLTVDNDVTFESGSTYSVEVTAGTTACDKLIVSGTLALGDGVTTLDIGTLDGVGRTIAIATNGLSGTFAGLADGAQLGTTGYYIHYEYTQSPKHITINQIPGVTSSGVDLRAYRAADGVYVEFVAYDVEEDGTIQLSLMDANGNPIWTGTANVVAGPQAIARFLVPGLEPGQTYSFRVRDEVGKVWSASGIGVKGFDAEMTEMTLTGATITFDSLPGREYDIQWTAQLGGEWQTVDTATASEGEATTVVVPHPAGNNAAGFFRIQQK